MKEPLKSYISCVNDHYPATAEFYVVDAGRSYAFGVFNIDGVIKLLLTHAEEAHNLLFLYQLREAVDKAFRYYINKEKD